MRRTPSEGKLLLCLRNDDCEDLVLHKVYRAIPDVRAEKEGYVRVVDDSGEDYLYPRSYFSEIKLPRTAQAAVLAAG